MSAPKILNPFELRLELVRAEVAKRLQQKPAGERNYWRAYLWNRWISGEILGVKV